MLWQERCEVVVMATNLWEKGHSKCERYWPTEIQEGTQLGNGIAITLLSETKFADYVISSIKAQVGDETRTLRHFQFTGWPDHGVPDTYVTRTILRKARASRSPDGYVPQNA